MTPIDGVAGPPPAAATTAPDRIERERRQTAEGFERLLVEQLTASVVRAALPDAGPYADLLPRTLADAIAGDLRS